MQMSQEWKRTRRTKTPNERAPATNWQLHFAPTNSRTADRDNQTKITAARHPLSDRKRVDSVRMFNVALLLTRFKAILCALLFTVIVIVIALLVVVVIIIIVASICHL